MPLKLQAAYVNSWVVLSAAPRQRVDKHIQDHILAQFSLRHDQHSFFDGVDTDFSAGIFLALEHRVKFAKHSVTQAPPYFENLRARAFVGDFQRHRRGVGAGGLFLSKNSRRNRFEFQVNVLLALGFRVAFRTYDCFFRTLDSEEIIPTSIE